MSARPPQTPSPFDPPPGSPSYVALTRRNLQDGAAFVAGAAASPILESLTLPPLSFAAREDWGIALENLYHGLLCLIAAQAGLKAARPVTPASVMVCSGEMGLDRLIGDILADFAAGNSTRLLRLPVRQRCGLLAAMVDELAGLYGDLSYAQEEWMVEREAMAQLGDSLRFLKACLRQAENGESRRSA